MRLRGRDEYPETGYWQGRYARYIRAVGEIVSGLPGWGKPGFSSLEIGPNDKTIIDGSDTMDVKDNPTYKQDAGMKWPIPDKKYSVVIACQVWEHLCGGQRYAFKEAVRCGHHVLLTVPYRWRCPSDAMHHNITDKIICEWTCGVKPVIKEIHGDSAHPVMLLMFSGGYYGV